MKYTKFRYRSALGLAIYNYLIDTANVWEWNRSSGFAAVTFTRDEILIPNFFNKEVLKPAEVLLRSHLDLLQIKMTKLSMGGSIGLPILNFDRTSVFTET